MTEGENLSIQADEIEALSSIYGSAFQIEEEACRSYSIVIEEGENNATLFFQLPEGYPGTVPPVYQLSAPWLKGLERTELCGQLDNVYLENLGETVIFQWVEKLRELLQNRASSIPTAVQECENLLVSDSDFISLENDETDIIHGDTIFDRKSTFQGHAAKVDSPSQVKTVIHKLKCNRKIANATHNMYAYRIKRDESGNYFQDCDDDGETQAGRRLLHLLQILDVSNVLVVVTRWYGGIHLGSDRFRHINNAARQVLQEAKLIHEPQEENSKLSKKSK